MIGLFNKRDSIIVIGGLVIYHILVCILCFFWIKKFLVYNYDPSVYLLIFMFVSITLLCDVLLYRVQVFKRFLLRCKFCNEGIYCTLFGIRNWKIKWDDICIFGTCGYSTMNDRGIIFLSTDRNEKYDNKKIVE